MISIWWIRRDLRLADNPALHAALQAGWVIPVFILDPAFSNQSPCRKSFLYEGLSKLNDDLRAHKSYLVLRKGKPVEVLTKLFQETGASKIHAEEDYTPYARKRDAEVAHQLHLELQAGQTVHHPEFVKKKDGTPYTVYTPYSRAWKSLPADISLIPAPKAINTPPDIFSEPLPEYQSNLLFPAGEAEAQRRLTQFTNEQITNYDETRDRVDLDGTSSLSPYIRFGIISLRQAVHAAKPSTFDHQHSTEIWLNELIWREFYIQILYHFPYVLKEAFNPALRNIPWRNDVDEFEKWKQGQTGLPIVDAAMRQLKETGWMHNRARMIAASFLVKDLLIDWRWGEAWFMENLLDGDPAANNGGWQWTAGTGTDAAPYFRIFNPVLQSVKFDPEGNYIRRWVPELSGLSAKEIHAPWEMNIKAEGYPKQPIIDHSIVKERTLNAYKFSKSNNP
ncbi:MAG: deoxyribodipyrimidine photo-lyase [Chloroflexi bacterium]|nr:deoxyribodipyrimidine photo-lyase [Chloroflexota bacterium]